MTFEAVIIWILIGIIADMVVGIIGAVIAGWLLPRLGITSIVRQPLVDNVIFAAIGAIILLVVLRLIKR